MSAGKNKDINKWQSFLLTPLPNDRIPSDGGRAALE